MVTRRASALPTFSAAAKRRYASCTMSSASLRLPSMRYASPSSRLRCGARGSGLCGLLDDIDLIAGHADAAALFGKSQRQLQHGEDASDLQCHRELDHALFAPARANGVADRLVVCRTMHDRVGELETEPCLLIHRPEIAAKHGFDLRLR